MLLVDTPQNNRTLKQTNISNRINMDNLRTGLTYNPVMFVCAHLADRVHVSTILEDKI